MQGLDLIAHSLTDWVDVITAYCEEHQEEFNEWKGTVVLNEEKE